MPGKARKRVGVDVLAMLVKNRLASEKAEQSLAMATMRCARITAIMAAQKGLIPWNEVDDIAQATVLRAWEYLGHWNATKGAWTTYVSRIARSVIGDYGRRTGRRKMAEDGYRELTQEEGRQEDGLWSKLSKLRKEV